MVKAYRQSALVLCGIIAVAPMCANESEQMVGPEFRFTGHCLPGAALLVVHGIEGDERLHIHPALSEVTSKESQELRLDVMCYFAEPLHSRPTIPL